jgi:hypothetical protein
MDEAKEGRVLVRGRNISQSNIISREEPVMAQVPVQKQNGNQAAPPAVTQMSIEAALKLIQEKAPEAFPIMSGVVRKDIVALGTDEAFALRDGEGEIRAFKQALTLKESSGTLVQPVPGGPFVVSAQGYEVWQEAAGACVIYPSEVLVDGKWQQNPAVIRDQKNGRILMIYARAVAFRFSSKGIPMVSDWTTIYDTPSYRMIDLLGKAKQFPQAFTLLPSEMAPEKEKGTWARYPFDEATNLWMNTTHDEALKWLAQIINREKKSIDFAQTFAKRNSLKHLSGIQKAPGNTWTVQVVCWRPISGNIVKWDATQYANLQTRVGKLISGDRSEFQKIEMVAGAERTSDDADAIHEEAVIDPEDQEKVIDVSPEKPENKQSAPLSKAMQNLIVAKKEFHGEYLAACQSAGIEPDSDMTDEQATQIIREMNRALDAAA